jgi:hypothetical protein
MEVLVEQRREARRGLDIAPALAGLINLVGVDVEFPWRHPHPPGPRQYARAISGQLLAMPLLTVGVVLDLLTLPFLRGRSNTYRLVARKQAG